MTNPNHTDTSRSGDLVERLLDFDDNWHEATCKEAADCIEALEAENERLQRSAEYWEQDAKRYAANQEHWRKEREAFVEAMREKENEDGQ